MGLVLFFVFIEDYVVKEEKTEDNDDYNSILRPAFAVDGEPDFDSGPPEDGIEYLRRVRWEAKRIPNVKVAKVSGSKYREKEQSVYMPQIPRAPATGEGMGGLVAFRLLTHSSGIPFFQLAYLSVFLLTDKDTRNGLSDTGIKAEKADMFGEKESGLESSDCKWVVALCASVDTPPDADTSACLRALVRKCASLRALEVGVLEMNKLSLWQICSSPSQADILAKWN
ncbi:hypothetical protein AXX17_AT2G39890 [Arabidopsis thaliana]|uniref:Uncharacterized protein n=1 Tax=Arabidopsis thaliana TaxID=3702 RepID=A0A178W232_ARATH|nr:hypothetical protein AXX17_AT2G39890 [Arabidopsis thaliana]